MVITLVRSSRYRTIIFVVDVFFFMVFVCFCLFRACFFVVVSFFFVFIKEKVRS